MGAFSCSLDLGSECGSASLSATSQPIGQARIATHIQAHTTKLQCTPAPGGNAPAIPCSDYAVAGQTRVGYDLYLVANAPSGSGVTGAILGIDYNGAFGQGVDALGWTSCGDLDFPGNGWPQAGGGNVITWTQANCQTQTLPGFESDGVHALLGAVYVYAYSPDLLRVTERTFTELQELQVSDCALNVADLPLSAVGKVAFTGGGQQDGYNPCAPTLADCLVVPEAVLFGVVSPGNSKTLPIAIHNPTSETLVVPVSELCSSVEFSLPPSNLTIPPFQTRML